jgi:hypothetical protein
VRGEIEPVATVGRVVLVEAFNGSAGRPNDADAAPGERVAGMLSDGIEGVT